MRRKQFFHRISVMGQIPAFDGAYFVVPNLIWASASGAFRIVFDALVFLAVIPGGPN